MGWVYFIFGLICLIAGGELLVRGSSGIAERNGISRLLIGLTIVSIGTSAPEFFISAYASWLGKTDIALGNVVGSNIFNILCALGLAATIHSLQIKRKTNTIDVPIMIVISIIFAIMAHFGKITRLDGAILFVFFIFYNCFLIYYEKYHAKQKSDIESYVKKSQSTYSLIFLIVLSLCLLPIGSQLLVNGATTIAKQLHISDLVISLTIVAAGTSIPEAVTAIMAARHKETDLIIGNVIGSNIANLSGVLGLGAILAPKGIPVSHAVQVFDIPIMLAASIACVPIFYTQNKVSRLEGLILFGYYLLFLAYVVLHATSHPKLPLLQHSLLYFCLPITVITSGFFVYREYHSRKP